jgi:CMP-N-acetylneuraminic acid synthetase
MSVIAIIPARGGSKGIPDKNLALLDGRPLIEWTVTAAQGSNRFAHIVVSTDSERIAEASSSMGAEIVMRPSELAQDDSPTISAVMHALSHFEAKTVVLLQPTSPLRTSDDIGAAMDLHLATERPVISVTPAKPWLFTKDSEGGLVQFTSTLDQRQSTLVFAPNGAIYIASAELLRVGKTWWYNAVAYEMPPERSVDIDTPTDLLIAEALLSNSRPSQVTAEQALRMVY